MSNLLQRSTTTTSAALPWRKGELGELQLLLITPRRDNNWTIPWAEIDGVSDPSDIAQRAAFRRAGLIGTCRPSPLLHEAEDRTSMEIFPMRVKGTLIAWPERKLWRRDWLSISAAAKKVDDVSLRTLILAVADDPALLSEN